MPNLIVSAVSTFDNKGLKKGQKEISAFDKTLKTLGKTFVGVFGAQKLLSFSKNAIKAFMADEKAAKSLELQLKNTGFAFSAPSIEYYIANLQKTTGVLDDELRPAFQQLLTVTQSVTLSQDALATSLNVSAATGKSLQEVTAAISKGYAGQTTGLSRLNAGLSKAILKTGNMEKIMAELNTTFAGQAAARLDTYAGKMDLLQAGAANAQETIGKGLLDALSLLSKDDSIQGAIDDMDAFAVAIADASYGMASLLKKLDKFTGLDKVETSTLLGFAFPAAGLLAKYGAKERDKTKSNFTYSLGPSADKDIARSNKILKERNKLAQDELNKMKAKSEVDKLRDKFDLERIGLTAALNSATDEETKLRIRAQLAILDNNEALAKKLLAEMNAAEAAKALADAAKKATDPLNAFGRAVSEMAATLNMQNKALQDEKMGKSSYVSPSPTFTSPGTTYAPFTGSVSELPATLNFINKGLQDEKIGKNSYVINIDASNMVDANNMNQVVQQALLTIQKEGGSTTYAGSL